MSQCGTSVPPVVAFVSFSSAITRALRASFVGCAAAIIDVSASIDRGLGADRVGTLRSQRAPAREIGAVDAALTHRVEAVKPIAGVLAAPNGPDCVASAPMAALEAQLSRIGEQGAIDTAHVVFVYERGSSAGEYYAAMYLDKYEGALGDRLRVLARDDIMLSAKVGRGGGGGGGGGGGRRLRNGNREGFAVPKAPIGCYAEDVDPRLAILVTPDVVTSLRGIMVYARELVDHSAPALAGI
jgi:hypothetical protein